MARVVLRRVESTVKVYRNPQDELFMADWTLKPVEKGQKSGGADYFSYITKLSEDSIFYRKTVFWDEAHYWLNMYVNKLNW